MAELRTAEATIRGAAEDTRKGLILPSAPSAAALGDPRAASAVRGMLEGHREAANRLIAQQARLADQIGDAATRYERAEQQIRDGFDRTHQPPAKPGGTPPPAPPPTPPASSPAPAPPPNAPAPAPGPAPFGPGSLTGPNACVVPGTRQPYTPTNRKLWEALNPGICPETGQPYPPKNRPDPGFRGPRAGGPTKGVH